MVNSLNLSLTDELRKLVNSRAGDMCLYATQSEYFRDLINQDMASQTTVIHVMNGLDGLKHGRFSDKSIMDIAEKN
ncbi:MAG: hypothetical protein L3J70_11980 [Gammaproteobacteria bacterium]|nr:hypothetical protein [Gammaproteobacteria bacterium]